MKLCIFISLVTLFDAILSNTIDSVPVNRLGNASITARLNLASLPPLASPGHFAHHPQPDLAWYKEKPAPADDVVWKRYVCKGSNLVAQMLWSDFDVAQALPVPQDTVQSPYMLGGQFLRNSVEVAEY